MKGLFKRIGALFGGLITFIALALILIASEKAVPEIVSLMTTLPLAFIGCIALSQVYPDKFAHQAIFAFVAFHNDETEMKTDVAKETKANWAGFALSVIHLLSWLALVIAAFILNISVGFWLTLVLSSCGVLFPLMLGKLQ